jgi:predicted transcriptional regulator
MTFEQINFVAGRRGAVVEDDFYDKLERLSVQAGKKDKILACMCNTYAKCMTQ